MHTITGSELLWAVAGSFTFVALVLMIQAMSGQFRLLSRTARRAKVWLAVTDDARALLLGEKSAGKIMSSALRHRRTRTIAVEAIADLARADRDVAVQLRGRRNDVQRISRWVSTELVQSDPGRRCRAAEVVGTLRLRLSRGPIAVAATDADPAVRVSACRALAVIDPSAAVGVLLRLVETDGPWAAHLLTDLLARAPERQAAIATRSIVDRAKDWAPTPALLRLLTSDTMVTSTELLVGILSHEDPELRARAAEALTLHESPDAIRALTGLLSDSHEQVRLAATRTLGGLAEPSLLMDMAALLDDHSRQVRFAAAAAIARTPGGSSLLRRAELGSEPRAAEAAGMALWRGSEVLPLPVPRALVVSLPVPLAPSLATTLAIS